MIIERIIDDLSSKSSKTKRKRKGNKQFCLKRDTACERLYQDLSQAVSFD